MRLWKTEKYWISTYLLFFLIFMLGFAYAADPSKVEGKYIEMSKGNDDAPVVFVEYASLTCPACAAFHSNVYPQLWINIGTVSYTHLTLPTIVSV